MEKAKAKAKVKMKKRAASGKIFSFLFVLFCSSTIYAQQTGKVINSDLPADSFERIETESRLETDGGIPINFWLCRDANVTLRHGI
ncbi:MAG: hypothetical protein LBL57_00620 [Tannerella sp.]|jgi:hypothetical protein|nr:hypothetical protein [Tannerella sp.]